MEPRAYFAPNDLPYLSVNLVLFNGNLIFLIYLFKQRAVILSELTSPLESPGFMPQAIPKAPWGSNTP